MGRVSVVNTKSPALLPETETAVIMRSAVPELVSVTVFAVLAVCSNWSLKFSGEGLNTGFG